MQTQKRKRYHKDPAPADDILTLIALVRQNPALYNYKLQPNQRRRADVLNGWAQIAAQIGNKYSVEECRRKWKNLRDTYHQYRLRKPKPNNGLARWRYARELDFLSNVYQPKLKSHRCLPNFDATHLLHDVHGTATIVHDSTGTHLQTADGLVHQDITLVNDDAETFILTAYDESVNDEPGAHDDPTMGGHMHDDGECVEDVVEIVKNEGAEYEEVCMYEDTINDSQNGGDTSDIMGGSVTRTESTDSKTYQYIDTSDFCIGTLQTHAQLGGHDDGSGGVIDTSKLKNVTLISSVDGSTTAGDMLAQAAHDLDADDTSILLQPATSILGQTREELDLFFDFLKKKMQDFTKEEITAIQVEFLNCVLRREAENAQRKNLNMQ